MIDTMINELLDRYPKLLSCRSDIVSACELLIFTFKNEKRMYICGNGGSAADSLHMTAELIKSVALNRSIDKQFAECVTTPELLENLQGALPVFALVENSAFATAYANDCNSEYIFAQQVYAYARNGDCVFGISSSGYSRNVLYAMETAKGRGAATLGLTGENGGILRGLCDVCICVPETETYKIQELHLPIYHSISFVLENYFWGEDN